MKSREDELIEGLMDALVEDYTLEELESDAFMKEELMRVMGLEIDEYKPLLEGAIEIKKVKENFEPMWEQMIIDFLKVH